jgi:hypothetical protein
MSGTEIGNTTTQWGTRRGHWRASGHGDECNDSYTFDPTTAVKATHYPNGFLLDGTPLGELTASPGVFRVWDAAAADGTQVLAGFADDNPQIENPDLTVKPFVGGARMVHGFVILGRLVQGFVNTSVDNTLVSVTAADLPGLIGARNSTGA